VEIPRPHNGQADSAIEIEANIPALFTMTSSTPPPTNGLNTQATDQRKDSLIEYPSQFPIKVMGAKVDGFVHAVTELARKFDPTFDAGTIELRDSRGGNYLGVTITITATSREQLDDLYRALSSHPMVKVVL
jgi:uncharacterized protein